MAVPPLGPEQAQAPNNMNPAPVPSDSRCARYKRHCTTCTKRTVDAVRWFFGCQIINPQPAAPTRDQILRDGRSKSRAHDLADRFLVWLWDGAERNGHAAVNATQTATSAVTHQVVPVIANTAADALEATLPVIGPMSANILRNNRNALANFADNQLGGQFDRSREKSSEQSRGLRESSRGTAAKGIDYSHSLFSS